MPLQLEVRRKLTERSDRVKCVDQHPSEPWLLCALYNGTVIIINYETQSHIKRFQVCDVPVRCAKFVLRKNWVVTGSDDRQVRVYNYNTYEQEHAFEAHSDYLRSIAIHPTHPYILTSSDDLVIKLWNWDRNWACQQVFEGHTHFVMQIVISPKDNNTFASASLDTTLKVWQLGSPAANFTLEGHGKGVNCVDYCRGGDKPYLISGGDDHRIKVWDYQNKTCVHTLQGHSQNVSAVCFHPELPVLLSGSEDGTLKVWHIDTYRLEFSVNYGLERIWTMATVHHSNNVAIGYDEGTILLAVGRDEPAVSMDAHTAKVIWAKHSEVQQINLRALPEGVKLRDGEVLSRASKSIGSCDMYPQSIAHGPNGRFVAFCGDGEYVVYTATALRNKAFGNASQFVWASDPSLYATLDNSTLRLFKNFKEKKSLNFEYGVEKIFGGLMLGVKSKRNLFSFYDWDNLDLIRCIEIQPRHVFWSEGGLACLAADDAFFVLRCDMQRVADAKRAAAFTEDGVQHAFEVVDEVKESVGSGLWVGDCFVYTTASNKVQYYVGGEVVTIAHLDHAMYLLGYVARDNRLYLNDKELHIVSYSLPLSVLEYQTALMRGDTAAAERLLPALPRDQRTTIAHFLEKQGLKREALAMSTDPEHQFELALSLGELERARAIAESIPHCSHLWARLGSAAVARDAGLAKLCYWKAEDFGGSLLLAVSVGDKELLKEVARECTERGEDNIAFLAYFVLNDLEACLQLLVKRNRLAEAALFARSYIPSKMCEAVKLWRECGAAANAGTAKALADPLKYGNLFPEFEKSLELEAFQREAGYRRSIDLNSLPPNWTGSNADRNLEEEKSLRVPRVDSTA